MRRFSLLSVYAGLMAVLSAQVLPVGTVDGTVKDPSGALLTGIKVTLTNTQTGQSREATTNDIGYYFFPLVNPGRYEVTTQRTGFKKGTQNVTVETGRRSTADFELELGAVTESVQVTGQAALLETSTAAVARNIQQKQIQDLPLLGRNPLKLMLLSAGVTANYTTTSNLLDVSGTSYVSANGANRRLNEFLLDGIPNNISDRVNYIPPVDVVEEFTIQTNALDAEYGHGGGAYINITTKSGTNEFHGQAYEFLRNERLNANSWLNNKSGTKKSPFRYNQFGVAAGGPAIKNKIFWFFNWEGVRQRTPAVYYTTTPTELQRQGDLSKTFDRLGQLIEIYDPFSTTQNAQGQWVRDPFPGNRIPSTRFDPIAKNVMARYPSPTGPGDPITGVLNFYRITPSTSDSNAYSIRVDPLINRHRIFARFSQNKLAGRTQTPFDIGGPEGNDRVQTSVGLSDTLTLSPTMIVTIQAGYSRWTQEGVHPDFDLGSLGFPTSLIGQMQQTIFPSFSVSGLMAIGTSEGKWFEHTNTASLNTGMTKMAGRHNMKAGFQMQIKQNNSVPAERPSGQYAFSNAFAQGPDPNRVATNSGSGIATFLLGTPASGYMSLRAYTAPQAPYYGWYFQDDFKVTPKLTLNLGLRYEVTLPVTERYNQSVYGFDRVTPNPIEAPAKVNYAKSPIPEIAPSDFRVLGGLVYCTPENRRNGTTDWNNWQPRIGAAYRLFPRTVLRGGFGMFYNYWWQPFVRADGFSAQTDLVSSLDGGRTPADLLRNPFPQGLVKPVGASLGMKTLLGQSVNTYYPDRKAYRGDRFNFGIQQEITRDTMVEIAYVGNYGKDLPVTASTDDVSFSINYYPEKYLALGSRLQDSVANPFAGLISTGTLSRATVSRATLLQVFPHFGAITVQRQTQGSSWYHSMQITGKHQMARGVMLQGTYTWSKSIEQMRYLNLFDPGPSKMIGEHDNPHRATLSMIIELPFGKGRRFELANPVLERIAGGWEVSGIYLYQTGQAAWLGASLATGVSPKISNHTIDNWFNRDALKILPNFTARRLPFMWNDLRVPNMNNWDIAILKKTRVFKERVNLQFRTELNNAFNRVWFGSPDVNPASANYGRIVSPQNSPRDIQLALKLTF